VNLYCFKPIVKDAIVQGASFEKEALLSPTLTAFPFKESKAFNVQFDLVAANFP
jgi:hypothetical protein